MSVFYLWGFCLPFINGCLSFVCQRRHLLGVLLSLEFTVLSMFMLLFVVFRWVFVEFSLGILFLVISVCEGRLGVSIMVSLVRSHGNDYLSSLVILKC